MDLVYAKLILGIGTGEPATRERVESAFRTKIRQIHPDLGGNDHDGKQKDELEEAKTLLLSQNWQHVADAADLNETQFYKRMRARLQEKEGCKVFKIHGGPMQEVGWPDTWIGCRYRGVHVAFWVELKVASNVVSAIQAQQIRELKRVGARAHVVRYVRGNIYCDDRLMKFRLDRDHSFIEELMEQ